MNILNRVLTLLVLHLILAGPANSQSNSDLLMEGLKGPVRSVSGHSLESLSIDGNETQGQDKKLDSLTFNSRGWLVERVMYDVYGFLIGTGKYSHDEAGNVIASEIRDPRGTILDKQIFKFENEKLKESTSLDARGATGMKEILSYESGILQQESYFMKARLLGKTSFKSDDRGNLIEAAFFLADGSKAVAPIGPCYNAHRIVYRYDNNRRVTEEITYNLDGSAKRKTTYRYDDRGNIAEELRVDNYSTLKFVHTYEYDRHDNWIRQIVKVHTSRLPLFGDKPDESHRRIVKQRTIAYY